MSELIQEGDVLIQSELDAYEVREALPNIANRLPVSVERALANWAEAPDRGKRRRKTLWDRDRYVTPGKVFEQMAVAYDAADDDIVSQFLDSSEALAFQKLKIESDDPDQADVWNQIAADLDLDAFVRQAWRELALVSQYVGVRYMDTRTYRVRGEANSRPRRKEIQAFVPTALGFLDPTRVAPVQMNPLGGQALAWIADEGDDKLFKDVKEGNQNDDLVSELILGRYTPGPHETKQLDREGIDGDRLWLLNPQMVWIHTLTKSTYERWPRIRMKSLFPLLDLKNQVREMDRAFLLGGINFLVLVKRGTENVPASASEVTETAYAVRTQANTPIMVTDHRIEVEIVTPDLSHVLSEEKWNTLDDRIMLRLWGGFSLPDNQSSGETSLSRARVIARNFSSRRHMLKRDIEKNVLAFTANIPLNREQFSEKAKLEYTPRRIELEFDVAVAQQWQALRDRGDLSRGTLLDEFDFDQETEARRRKAEDEKYSKPGKPGGVFSPTNVPFDSPQKTTPNQSGRDGGRPRTQNEGE